MLEVIKLLYIDIRYCALCDMVTVNPLQLKQLKLELHNAIHAHRLTPDSYLVAKAYLPVNGPSSQHHAHRIPLRPTTKKSYVFLMSRYAALFEFKRKVVVGLLSIAHVVVN